MPVSEAEVIEALRPVQDPELRRSIVDLGMVKGVVIDGGRVDVEVALTVAGCPLRAEIDRRVRYLSKRLESLKVVDAPPSDRDAVFFGAEVELENIASGELVRYRIVGPDETDAQRGWISIDAPLARAMLKKRVDDEFEAMLPAGAVRFAIVEVSYAG